MSFKHLAQSFFGCKGKSPLPDGAAAPVFALGSLSGEKLTLADALQSGPVLLAFFKISCPTCQFTFPFLQRIYERYGSGQFTFWAISQNDAQDTQAFLDRFAATFPALLDDPGYPVSNAYGITNVPTIFLISPGGKIQMSSVGFSKTDLEKIAAEAARAGEKQAGSIFAAGENIPAYKPG